MNSLEQRARELVTKLAAHVRPTCSELWDEAQAFLATDKVEQRAWELLEAECGKPLPFDVPVSAALSAIKAALSQQPEARGVVDEVRRVAREMRMRSMDGATRSALLYSDDMRTYADRLAALTEARDVR